MSRGNLPCCGGGVGREPGDTLVPAAQPGSADGGCGGFAEFAGQDQDPQVQTNAVGCPGSGSTAVTSGNTGSGVTECLSNCLVCLILLKQSLALARCWARVQSHPGPFVFIVLQG